MTQDLIDVLQGSVAGCLVGAVFFVSLWWTVRGVPTARRPTGLLALSFVLRMVLVLGTFTLLAVYGGTAELLGGLAGFLLARWFAIARAKAGTTILGQER